MSHSLAESDTMRRRMHSVAADYEEHEGKLMFVEELVEWAEEAHPGHLDRLDLEDLAHEVLFELRRYPPGRARLKEAARG